MFSSGMNCELASLEVQCNQLLGEEKNNLLKICLNYKPQDFAKLCQKSLKKMFCVHMEREVCLLTYICILIYIIIYMYMYQCIQCVYVSTQIYTLHVYIHTKQISWNNRVPPRENDFLSQFYEDEALEGLSDINYALYFCCVCYTYGN